MNEFKFSCPHCHQILEATPEHAGMQLNCPSCQAPIVVPSTAPQPPQRASKLSKVPSTVQYAATSRAMATAMARQSRKPRIGLYIGLAVTAAVAVAAILIVPKQIDKYNERKEAAKAAEAAAKAPPPPPPELTADEILAKLNAAYKGLTSYSAQAIAVGTVDSSQINPAMKEPVVLTTKLSLRLGRPSFYRMEWERDAGKQQIKGAVWDSGKGDFLHAGTLTTKEKTPEAAFTKAAAASATLGPYIAALFFSATNSPGAIIKDYSKTNSETLDSQKCYVLTGEVDSRRMLFWIRKSDFLIAQTELILGGKVNEAELAGLSYAQKAAKERAAKLRGNFTETYQDIVVNKPLNPNDFESSFPPNASASPKQQRQPRAGGPGRGMPH